MPGQGPVRLTCPGSDVAAITDRIRQEVTAMGPHKGATLSFQPRIRKGAFFEAAWRHGCRSFSVYNRTYIPGSFSGPVEEYWHVINHVALWPVMGERQVEITGPDAARFVQRLTPRNMADCAVGQCKYALIAAEDGGILCDPIILRLEENRFWLSTSDCDLELWARGVAVGAGLEVRIRDAGISTIQIQGPKSAALMAKLFGESLLDLKYYWMMRLAFEGSELVASRTGWSGELGYELYLADAAKGDALFDALMAAGCVSQVRRIEAGILSSGVDMTPAESPYEVGLGRLVELEDTPDFIGKEALRRLKAEPPRRRLVGLVVRGEPLAANEDVWPLRFKGQSAGRLTSLSFSLRLEQNIALALVDSDFAEPGGMLMVETWDDPPEAVVSELPLLAKRQTASARAAAI